MKQKKIKAFFIAFSTMAVTAVAFTNCGEKFDPTLEWGYFESNHPPMDTAAGGELGAVTTSLPYALLSAEQSKYSMLKLTGLTTCTGFDAEYTKRSTSMAAGNDLTLINGPLLISTTSLAGVACNCLLDKEKALADGSRAFYNGLNLNGGLNAITDSAYQSVTQSMAKSFWSRAPSSEEAAALSLFKTEFTANTTNATNATSTKNFLNALCSSMLSSFDSISY